VTRPSTTALLLLTLLTVASCSESNEEQTSRLIVAVSIDVCSDGECFVAPVPGAEVTVDGVGAAHKTSTDEDGVATFEMEGGSYEIAAEWQGSKGEDPSVSVNNDGSTEVSLRLSPAAATD
jgi:hypothetical protein